MVRRSISAAAALAVALGLWPCASLADGALAIGMINGNSRHGFTIGVALDKPLAKAKDEALEDCRRNDVIGTSRLRAACEIVETFRNQCASTAFNGDDTMRSGGFGWGVGPDSEIAKNRALEMCDQMRAGRGFVCHPYGQAYCDGTAQ
jgi:uncharacterized protein DUF4189